MKIQHTVLALIVALTACAAPEPNEPPRALPELPAIPGQPAVVPARVQLAQAPVPPTSADMLYGRPPKGGRSLIIQSSDPDPKAYANMEEDLSVMYRILSKTRKDENPFGNRLESIVWGASEAGPPVRSMYLEGYGAVFMLHVRFPLVAPNPAEEQAKPKDNTSEEWERAKAELSARSS